MKGGLLEKTRSRVIGLGCSVSQGGKEESCRREAGHPCFLLQPLPLG